MIVLRLDQSAAPGDSHHIRVRLLGGSDRAEATNEFAFRLSDGDREDVRWYFEESFYFPEEAGPRVAERIEGRLAEIGTILFQQVFGPPDATRIWAQVRDRLSSLRVEVSSDVAGAAVLPWELLRDPDTGMTIALSAESFVRVNAEPATPYPTLPRGEDALRVLLVICRPEAAADVPFRSVAARIAHVQGTTAGRFDVDVLRPPTFERLAEVLSAAWDAGRPYGVVHFDGHGTYIDAGNVPPDLLLSSPASGPRGYLVFEDQAVEANVRFVDGPSLGTLLSRTGVAVLVLNACRSAYVEEPSEPDAPFYKVMFASRTQHYATFVREYASSMSIRSPFMRSPVPAYGSLAMEVTDAGVPGVVAMRYSVLVGTAADFVAGLYDALVGGQPLGTAVSTGRKRLAANAGAGSARELRLSQDWSVPVVYEPTPLVLFDHAVAGSGAIPADLAGFPQAPAGGFIGRHETLLAVDRTFDTRAVALLVGVVGSGKTATAVEFARWYAATGGIGPARRAAFTSFDTCTTLQDVLGGFASATGLAESADREAVLDAAAGSRILWIWDGLEWIDRWSQAERDALLELLLDLDGTRARVLLTSRRPEIDWLDNLPVRIVLPDMPPRERLELAEAVAAQHGHHLADADAWHALLRFSAGNPLTIRALAAQVASEQRTGPGEVEALAGELLRGEGTIADPMIAASLGRGFDAAFTRTERAQLAILHLFQVSVDVAVLTGIGDPSNAASLPEFVELTRPVAEALLDRAACLGVAAADGDGRYRLHPALPWYVGRLYAEIYGPRERHDRIVLHAFTASIARHGRRRAELYRSGHAEVVAALEADEMNLLNATTVALRGDRWAEAMGCLQGLRVLYRHLGRHRHWEAVLHQLLTHPTIGSLTAERFDEWRQLLDFQVELARARRDWDDAERLIRTIQRGEDARTNGMDQQARLQQLAAGFTAIGHILRERGSPDCVEYYWRAGEFWQQLGDVRETGLVRSHLADAYLEVADLRDLDMARDLYHDCLLMMPVHDRLGRAAVLVRLARADRERLAEARRDGAAPERWRPLFESAWSRLVAAAGQLPTNATAQWAALENAVGLLLATADESGRAILRHLAALRVYDRTDRLQAGVTRLHAARAMDAVGRFRDALLYARAARDDFILGGATAVVEVAETEVLIGQLEQRAGEFGPDDGEGRLLVGV